MGAVWSSLGQAAAGLAELNGIGPRRQRAIELPGGRGDCTPSSGEARNANFHTSTRGTTRKNARQPPQPQPPPPVSLSSGDSFVSASGLLACELDDPAAASVAPPSVRGCHEQPRGDSELTATTAAAARCAAQRPRASGDVAFAAGAPIAQQRQRQRQLTRLGCASCNALGWRNCSRKCIATTTTTATKALSNDESDVDDDDDVDDEIVRVNAQAKGEIGGRKMSNSGGEQATIVFAPRRNTVASSCASAAAAGAVAVAPVATISHQSVRKATQKQQQQLARQQQQQQLVTSSSHRRVSATPLDLVAGHLQRSAPVTGRAVVKQTSTSTTAAAAEFQARLSDASRGRGGGADTVESKSTPPPAPACDSRVQLQAASGSSRGGRDDDSAGRDERPPNDESAGCSHHGRHLTTGGGRVGRGELQARPRLAALAAGIPKFGEGEKTITNGGGGAEQVAVAAATAMIQRSAQLAQRLHSERPPSPRPPNNTSPSTCSQPNFAPRSTTTTTSTSEQHSSQSSSPSSLPTLKLVNLSSAQTRNGIADQAIIASNSTYGDRHSVGEISCAGFAPTTQPTRPAAGDTAGHYQTSKNQNAASSRLTVSESPRDSQEKAPFVVKKQQQQQQQHDSRRNIGGDIYTTSKHREQMTILEDSLSRLMPPLGVGAAATGSAQQVSGHSSTMQLKTLPISRQHNHPQTMQQQMLKLAGQQPKLSEVVATRGKCPSYLKLSASNLHHHQGPSKCARLTGLTNQHLEAPRYCSGPGLQQVRRNSAAAAAESSPTLWSSSSSSSLADRGYLQAASNQIKRKLSADYSLGHVQPRPPSGLIAVVPTHHHHNHHRDHHHHQQQQQQSSSPPTAPNNTSECKTLPPFPSDASDDHHRETSVVRNNYSTISDVDIMATTTTHRESRSLSTCSTLTTSSSTHSLSSSSGFSSPATLGAARLVDQPDQENQAPTGQNRSAKQKRVLRRQQHLALAESLHHTAGGSSCSLNSSASSSLDSASASTLSEGNGGRADNDETPPPRKSPLGAPTIDHRPLHPTVSALLLSTANLKLQKQQITPMVAGQAHKPQQQQHNKPAMAGRKERKRSRQQQQQQRQQAGTVKPLSIEIEGAPSFVLDQRIQDLTYFESCTSQAVQQQHKRLSPFAHSGCCEPPPRPWLEPANGGKLAAKRASLAGLPGDLRSGASMRLMRAQALAGRHHSIGGELPTTTTTTTMTSEHVLAGTPQTKRISATATTTTTVNGHQHAHLFKDNEPPPQAPSVISDEFTALSYNVLSDRLVNTERFPSSPDIALNWLYRRELILRQLGEYDADLIALQEIEMEQFCDYFEPQLCQRSQEAASPSPANSSTFDPPNGAGKYVGLFESKSRARTMMEAQRKRVDGCAIFFKRSRFRLIGKHLLEFNQLAMANSRGSEHMINRVSLRDNIAMVAVLELIERDDDNHQQQRQQQQTAHHSNSGSHHHHHQTTVGGDVDLNASASATTATGAAKRLLVCNTHIHWDPEFCDVKLIQTIMLMNELKSIAQHYSLDGQLLEEMPLILLGDFNSKPDSGVTSYLLDGHISSLHEDFKSFEYSPCAVSLAQNAFDKHHHHQRGEQEEAVNPLGRRPSLALEQTTGAAGATLSSTSLLDRRRQSSPLASGGMFAANRPLELAGSSSSISPSSTASSSSSSFGLYSSSPRSSSSSSGLATNFSNNNKPQILPIAKPPIIDYEHPFELSSAYGPKTMPFTNYTTKFQAIIDYIFYSHNSLTLLGLLGPLDKRWLRGNKIRGFPQIHFPSDHLPLLVKFKLINQCQVAKDDESAIASPSLSRNEASPLMSLKQQQQQHQFSVNTKSSSNSNNNDDNSFKSNPATWKQQQQQQRRESPIINLKQSVKKSNKKQKHLPRKDRPPIDLANFNQKQQQQQPQPQQQVKQDQQQQTNSLPRLMGNKLPPSSAASAAADAAAVRYQPRTFWSSSRAAFKSQVDLTPPQHGGLVRTIKVSEKWS